MMSQVVDDRGKNFFASGVDLKEISVDNNVGCFYTTRLSFCRKFKRKNLPCKCLWNFSCPKSTSQATCLTGCSTLINGGYRGCNVTWMPADSWEVPTAENIGSQLGSRFPREVNFRGLPNGCRGKKKPKIIYIRQVHWVCLWEPRLSIDSNTTLSIKVSHKLCRKLKNIEDQCYNTEVYQAFQYFLSHCHRTSVMRSTIKVSIKMYDLLDWLNVNKCIEIVYLFIYLLWLKPNLCLRGW